MNADTKRHIDSARQVLVGVVPNPASQIDQITNALIYKFMDDMDQAAIKAGGEPSFFVGSLKDYAWTRLMDSKVGNQQRMNLYSEALVKFSEAKQLPELFRGIFKSAYLPYRSPEVLDLFLKEINYFDYSHSEELGNAYEYLLSIMSSQGDAGQFRTPRHIIDFIVEVVNPTKDDKVLDPACGTAGFLISAYKHILSQHDGKNPGGTKNSEKPLTPDQRKTLVSNFEGYDIDPGMVRISQVNMYLHQFKNPKIYQYDSLSSDERWGDKFDVILANPPFMSPKGGIKPHSKFSIQSNRSEVLFVDYIMNHLRPKGRAGIIVPEGIIFQSGKSHTQLRRKLVEDGLYAVVSLPSGVFQPYSGVKTSILFFDNELAKQKKEILFIKIGNDGFDLGAQRRPIDKDDLPEAVDILKKWREGKKIKSLLVNYIERIKIAENGDYNLSADRYCMAVDCSDVKWPMVELGDIADVLKGSAITKKDTINGSIPVIAGGQQPAYYHNKANRSGDVITVSASGAYAGFVNFFETPIFASDCSTIQTKDEFKVSTRYIFNILKAKQEDIYAFQQGGGQPHVYSKDLKKIKLPLPPIEVQKQLIDELNSYQKIISGARQVIDNWKPRIDIDPKWEKVKLETLVEILDSKRRPITKSDRKPGQYPYYGATGILDYVEGYIFEESLVLVGEDGAKWGTGDQTAFIAEGKYWVNNHAHVLRALPKKIVDIYLVSYLNQIDLSPFISGVTVPKLNQENLKSIKIPTPSLEIQKQIVDKIEFEKGCVEPNKKLIDIYEQKIKDVIVKLWEK